MAEKENAYFYFVDNQKYESDLPTLTGAQIKARITNFNAGYTLTLEGHGNDPDRIIGDAETVGLEKEKGPKRFFTAPPATFGR